MFTLLEYGGDLRNELIVLCYMVNQLTTPPTQTLIHNIGTNSLLLHVRTPLTRSGKRAKVIFGHLGNRQAVSRRDECY